MSEQKVVNKRTFEVEIDGNVVKLAVIRPNHKVQQQATLVYNRAFREAVTPTEDGKKGAIVRQAVDSFMRDQKTWDDFKQKKYEEFVSGLLTGERKLAQGGIKLSEARAVAVKMRLDRWGLRALTATRNEYDAMTAEAQAEQARFNHFVAACTVYADTGKAYFKDVDDYLGRENDPVVLLAAQNFGKLFYGLDDDYESKLPENKFLIKYGFAKVVNNEVRLVRKSDGKYIDESDRLVDEKGRLVNEAGELIDSDGNLLTEDGEYKVEFKEFEDDVTSTPLSPAQDEAKVAA